MTGRAFNLLHKCKQVAFKRLSLTRSKGSFTLHADTCMSTTFRMQNSARLDLCGVFHATLCHSLQHPAAVEFWCCSLCCRELQRVAECCISLRVRTYPPANRPYSRKQGRLFCIILLTLCSSHFIFISVHSLSVAHCTNLAISATHTTINLTKHTTNTSTRWRLHLALCCHSNEICALIANPPNSAQLDGTPYHSPSYIQVRA